MTPTFEHNEVYKFVCRECEAIYAGKTGRTVETRIKEHLRDKTVSAFGKNLFNHGYHMKRNKTELFHKSNKGKKKFLNLWKVINTGTDKYVNNITLQSLEIVGNRATSTQHYLQAKIPPNFDKSYVPKQNF